METMMIIETTHGGLLFSLMYLAAFLAAAGSMIFYGFENGYPKGPWLLILLTSGVAFIIGDKIFTYSSGDWIQVFTRLSFPVPEKKTVLGGIAGLFAGIFVARTWLRFNRPVFDAFAIALPLGMAISRVGCLMAGCCFGTPTDLPWGIQYDAASWVYQVHVAQGLVNIHDEASHAVHPAQLYQAAGCMVIAFVVWWTRKLWRSNGSMFLFSVLCYAVLRFSIEFVRAPESNGFAGEFFFGLKTVQWLILGAIMIGFPVLLIRESHARQVSSATLPFYVPELRQGLMVVMLGTIVYLGRNWFDLMEMATIMLFFIPITTLVAVSTYRNHSVAGSRLVLPGILICCVSFMAQKSNTGSKEDENIIFTDVGLIGMAGRYFQDVQTVSKQYIPGGCEKPGYYITTLQYLDRSRQTLRQGGIDISRNIWRGKYNKFSFGARGFYGTESGDYTTVYPNAGLTLGISPYVTFEWQYAGIGTGFSVGQMKLPIGEKPVDSYSGGTIVSNGYNNVYFMPALSIRLGPTEIVYLESSYPAMFPSTAPYPMFRAGMGSGLGKANGTKVAIGYCEGIYVQAAYPIRNRFILEAAYADNLSSGNRSKRILSFGVHYRIISDKKPAPKKNQKLSENQSYAENPVQERKTFSELPETVIDLDGHIYHLLAVGSQVWMAEDLKSTRFSEGSEIPGVSAGHTGSGNLYVWEVVNDSRKLCPNGWHVPSLSEWKSLYFSLGAEMEAVGKLETDFTAGEKTSHWWSSTAADSLNAKGVYLNGKTVGVMFTTMKKSDSLRVRCTRDL